MRKVSGAPYAEVQPSIPSLSTINSAHTGLPNSFNPRPPPSPSRPYSSASPTPGYPCAKAGSGTDVRRGRSLGHRADVKAAPVSLRQHLRTVVRPGVSAIRAERRHRLSGQRRFEIRRVIPCALRASSCHSSAATISRKISNSNNSTLRFIGLRQWFYTAAVARVRQGTTARQRHQQSPAPYPADRSGFVVQAHGPRAVVASSPSAAYRSRVSHRQSPPRSSPSAGVGKAVSPRAAPPPGSPWRVTPMRPPRRGSWGQ